jgi:hypothetical protein
MRILLTNDDGIHAEGLASLERSPTAVRRCLGGGAGAGPVRLCAFAVDLGAAAGCARSARSTMPCAARRPIASSWASSKILPAPPDLILSGINSGAEHRRRRDLFGNRGRCHGRRADRHPFDRAQPGLQLCRRRARRALRNGRSAGTRAAEASCRDANCRSACCSMSTFPTARRKRSPDLSCRPRRASWPTASGSTSAATAAACLTTGCASVVRAGGKARHRSLRRTQQADFSDTAQARPHRA